MNVGLIETCVRKHHQSSTKQQQPPKVARLPEANVRNDSFLQRLFVTWVYAVVNAGRRGVLDQHRLRMPKAQSAEDAADRFLKAWRREQECAAAEAAAAVKLGNSSSGSGSGGDGTTAAAAAAAARQKGGWWSTCWCWSGGGTKAAAPRQPRQPSVARALFAAFGREFAAAGAFKLLWSAFVLLGASYFVNALIEFVQGKLHGADALPGKGVGWVLSAAFFADSLLVGLALQRMGDAAVRVGIQARAALMTAVSVFFELLD
jgi:hypothetical protein